MGSLKKNAGDKNDENVHPVLEHGKEVLKEYLNLFGFASMEEAEDYLVTPADTKFDHIPQTVPLEILMVAEKPSTALEIVLRLSLGRFSCSGTGQNKVFHFQGMVFGRHANVWVASTFGHLTEQTFKEELSSDEAEKALRGKIVDISCNSSLSYEFFAKLGRGCDAVILWLDNDHEGEAISFEKFDLCRVVDGPIHVKSECVKAPAGMNSCRLLQDQSKYFGRPPVATADIAQSLYTKAMTTYSRTETTKHPKDMKLSVWQLRANLLKFMKDDDLGFSPNMNFDEEKAKERGINRGDHPPIMPIGKPLSRYAGNLSKEEIEVYHYICRQFLASSMPDYQYSNKKVMLEMGNGYILPYQFEQNDVLGFTEVLPEYKVPTPGDAVVAELVRGAEFKYTVSIKEYPHQRFLLEHELIEKMEQYNVGTDGTIPNYIETMERDGYVKVDPKTRELKPTGLGIKMIEAYRGRECIPDMVDPKYREKFIQGIEEIASGKRDFVTFYNETMKDVYVHYKKFDAYLERYIEAAKDELKPLVKEKNDQDMAMENEKKMAREEAEKKLKLEK
uniref:DNA topoisomerase n=1 Tax=Panagrolaimus sp. PS1159 TaxID=55785 RepID=A0AC35G4M6_9BILA